MKVRRSIWRRPEHVFARAAHSPPVTAYMCGSYVRKEQTCACEYDNQQNTTGIGLFFFFLTGYARGYLVIRRSVKGWKFEKEQRNVRITVQCFIQIDRVARIRLRLGNSQ